MKTIRGRSAAIPAIPVAIALLVGGCAETELAIHTAKRIEGHAAGTASEGGTYKVGLPYKIGSKWYYPKVDYDYVERGIASWYGPNFHGRLTANGEQFNQNELTAAHRTLPLPSLVRVTNLENGRSLVVRVNDRGPFARGRIIDLSRRAAQLLGFSQQGTARVEVRILANESRQVALAAGAGEIPKGDRIAPPPQPPTRVEVATLAPEAGRIEPVSARSVTFPNPGKPTASPDIVSAPTLSQSQSATIEQNQSIAAVVSRDPASIFVQAGAYSSFESANRVRKRLAKLARAEVSSTTVGAQKFYRVRLGPLESVASADMVLDRVVASGFTKAQMVVE